ncbi:MAG: YdjY domain-containing protein [Planctomycetota bacterium]
MPTQRQPSPSRTRLAPDIPWGLLPSRSRWLSFAVITISVSCLGAFAAAQDLPAVNDDDSPQRELTQEEFDRRLAEEEARRPDRLAAKAFLPPPQAKRLSKDSHLWVDVNRKRVYVDGYVAMKRGPLEMFACPSGTKEHESVVAVLAKSSEVHPALLAVGASTGTPVRFQPRFLPPTGQQIRVWVTWFDDAGKFRVSDARRWVKNQRTQKQLKEDWVFAGSSEWKDPEDGKVYYEADAGDLICVSNFASAMMDVPFESSADADALDFVPFESRIPKRGTPVRLVLIPIPLPRDPSPDGQGPPKLKGDPNREPTEAVLALRPKSSDAAGPDR